jgi:hypothetical protein
LKRRNQLDANTVRAKGICLRNARIYGSPVTLRRALRKDQELIVRLREAKEFKFVKMCLIKLW